MNKKENKDLEKKKGPHHKTITRECEGGRKEGKDERNKERLEPQSEENKKNEEVSRNRLGMQMGNTFHNMGSEHVSQHEP